MQYEWIKSVESRVVLFKSFYERQNERPLFGFFKDSEYPLFRYPFSRALPEGQPLTPEDFNIKSFVNDSEKLWSEHETCGGDFIFSACAFWGIPWLEAALGCPIFADHSTGSIYSKPPKKITPEDVPEFSPDSPWIRLMKDRLNELTAKSAGRFPLATTRMRGISDLLSALYGGDSFIFAMLENPEEVKAYTAQLTEFFIKTAKHQLKHIPEFHGGIGSFYYYMWAPVGTVWHQEDAAALLSPDIYEEFIEPCDRKIVRAFSHVIIHEHSTGFVPIQSYLDMDMTALEMHIDIGGPSAEELFEKHMNILEQKPLLIWGDIPEKDLDWIFDKLPCQGLAINTIVNSSEQAEQLWNKYIKKK